jgi:hypothetical protein
MVCGVYGSSESGEGLHYRRVYQWIWRAHINGVHHTCSGDTHVTLGAGQLIAVVLCSAERSSTLVPAQLLKLKYLCSKPCNMLLQTSAPAQPSFVGPNPNKRGQHCSLRATAAPDHSTRMVLNPADIQPVQCLKEWAVTCAALGAGQQTVGSLVGLGQT